MESFYGGRTGASVSIVKKFDCISFPVNDGKVKEIYTGNFYAVDDKENIFIKDKNNKPIARTELNKDEYKVWRWRLNDGTIEDGITFEKILASSMVDFFKKGAQTTSEVNYGEYVLIDTISGLNKYNDLDNGKIYRRGFDFDGPLGGAEFVGRIVGPQGEIGKIALTGYEDITAPAGKGQYDIGNNGLVPGKTEAGDFNDEIKYNWITLQDNTGNVEGNLLGFQFPYLVEDFTAKQISPYDENGHILENPELAKHLAEEVKEHPYYDKWEVSIPTGVRGISITEIDKIDTCIKTGAEIFKYDEDTDSYINTGKKVLNNYDLSWQDEAYDFHGDYLKINYKINENEGLKIYYVENNLENTLKRVIRFKYTIYDKEKNGQFYKYEIADFDEIKGISIDENGKVEIIDSIVGKKTIGTVEAINKITMNKEGELSAYWTDGEKEVQKTFNMEKPVQWVDAIGFDDSTKKLTVKYNTSETFDKIPMEEGINWIDSMSVDTRIITEEFPVKDETDTYILKDENGNDLTIKKSIVKYHLLVYYAAPDRRGRVPDDKQVYIGRPGIENDWWEDIGDIRGTGDLSPENLFTINGDEDLLWTNGFIFKTNKINYVE